MLIEMTKDKKSLDLLVVRSLLSDGDFIRAKQKGLGGAWHKNSGSPSRRPSRRGR